MFRTLFHRQFLPYLNNIGPPELRRKMLEMIPSKDIKDIIHVVDTLDSGSRKIVSEKRAALEKGDQGVKQLVSQGKDILSALCE